MRSPTTVWILVLGALVLCLFALQEPEESHASESIGLHGIVWAPGRAVPASGAQVHLRPVEEGVQSLDLESDEHGHFGVVGIQVFGDYRVDVEWRDEGGELLRLTTFATFGPESKDPLDFVFAK